MTKGKGKGSAFERDVCKRLSVWWTGDPKGDCFWRSAMSGGRSTVTGTSTGAGDIVGTTARGDELVQLVTFEVKRGYPTADPFAMVEGPRGSSVFEGFIDQAEESRRVAGSRMWSIIHKRDRRNAMIYFDWRHHDWLDGQVLDRSFVHLCFGDYGVTGCKLDDFLNIDPEGFQHYAETYM